MSAPRGRSASPAVKNVRTRPRESVAPLPPSSEAPISLDAAPARPSGSSRVLPILRGLAGALMIAAIGSGVAWGARTYVRTSPRFAVSEIVTSGGKRRAPEDLASIAGIARGQNVFSVDLEVARARLAADPWIAEAEVARQLPGTIVVRVLEHEAAGIVAVAEGTYLVTRDGAVIKRAEAGDPLAFHVVTGVSLGALVDDRDGASRTIRRALDLAFDYDRSPLARRSPVEEVHVEPNGGMSLVIGKSNVTLRMGSAPYRRKLDQAVRVVGELDRRGAKPDVIMLDDEARPDRVVVRMR